MKKELNTNNSKKLIIGISILFCAVILIVGATTAYFTQSGIGDTGNIVTENINGTIGYTDNNDYMRNNLIPVMGTDVDDFAMKNSLNGFTNNDICVYTNEYNACSLYEFTITNNANVTQELMLTLNPSPNQYANLYYMMYEGEQETLTTSSKVVKSSTHIDGNNASTMANNIILKPNESKTYTVVFYILNLETVDQTSVDAGKHFGAIIRVDSITTGTYVSNTVGETCYDMEDLGDETFKLTKFNGLNEDGSVVEGCGINQDETTGLYSVTIPSNIGSNQISTLGNILFQGITVIDLDTEEISLNNYSKITNIEIEEGITEIEDGSLETFSGTFLGIGLETLDFNSGNRSYYDNVTVTFPSTLTKIGDFSFGYSGVKNIIFNKNEQGESNLTSIGNMAFAGTNLSSVTIPYSVTSIGDYAFNGNVNLTSLTFEDTTENPSQLTTIGDSAFEGCNITSLQIPYSVTSIGEDAFYGNYNLSKLTFAGSLTEITEDNQLTIGSRAFYGDGLEYLTEDAPLILPARIKSIGDYAFDGNGDDPIRESLLHIRYMGDRNRLDSLLGTNWYNSSITTVKAYGE